MRKKPTLTAPILAVAAVATVVFAQRQGTNTAPASGPQGTAARGSTSGRRWTPDGLNGNKEGFPGYHAAGPQATAIPRWFAR